MTKEMDVRCLMLDIILKPLNERRTFSQNVSHILDFSNHDTNHPNDMFYFCCTVMSMSHLYGRREEEDEGVEVESFEVTDWDLANEFNPERQRFRQTKEQATYGIWAERDSDEDERPSFGGKK